MSDKLHIGSQLADSCTEMGYIPIGSLAGKTIRTAYGTFKPGYPLSYYYETELKFSGQLKDNDIEVCNRSDGLDVDFGRLKYPITLWGKTRSTDILKYPYGPTAFSLIGFNNFPLNPDGTYGTLNPDPWWHLELGRPAETFHPVITLPVTNSNMSWRIFNFNPQGIPSATLTLGASPGSGTTFFQDIPATLTFSMPATVSNVGPYGEDQYGPLAYVDYDFGIEISVDGVWPTKAQNPHGAGN